MGQQSTKNQKNRRNNKSKKINKKLIILIVAISVFIVAAVIITAVIIHDKTANDDKVTVVMEVRDYGNITMELYRDIAPISVDNFLDYVNSGFYNGLTFHRVIEDFMIQGGDPTGTGYGDSSLEKIKGEFSANGVKNNLKFERGVLGMARSGNSYNDKLYYNTASSQFFICQVDYPSLDGKYASFGKVIEGMDVVDEIAKCQTDKNNKPVNTVYIEKMYVK